MKNEKQPLKVIDEFPVILYSIMHLLADRDNVNYILDASGYSKPVPLMTIANPDALLLDINLPRKAGIALLQSDIQNNPALKLGMITTNSRFYYMSLCATLSPEYFFDKSLDIESVTNDLLAKQLN
jgi:DNA-binding NarL/FixJ family response regulator